MLSALKGLLGDIYSCLILLPFIAVIVIMTAFMIKVLFNN